MSDWRTLMDEPTWMEDANCRGMGTTLFFPVRGEPQDHVKAICRACDVQSHCLAYALNGHETHGMWGGMSERARRRLRRVHGGPQPVALIEHGTNAGYAMHLRVPEVACGRCTRAHADHEHFTRPSRSKPA